MKKKFLLATGLFVLFSSVLIFSCSKSSSGYGTPPGGGGNPPPANTVSLKSIAFSPSSLTVTAGTTVTWTNNDNITHTVTADDNSFDSGNMSAGATFSHMFTTVGTYSYHCAIHASMTAKIVVQ
jgi:plastocyanin